MKKLFILLSVLFSIASFGQFPNKQFFGSANTLTTFNGGAKSSVGFINSVYTDTTTANLNAYIKSYPGAQIIASGKLWVRNAAATAWQEYALNSSLMPYPGAGIPQSTGSAWGTSITPGTGVVTALGINVGSSGAFVTNGGALGTPSSGTVTNLTGTASININGTVGATTPTTGAFTTVTASGTVSGSTFTSTCSGCVALTMQNATAIRGANSVGGALYLDASQDVTTGTINVRATTLNVSNGLAVTGAATVGTSLTTPLVIGGTGTTSTLTYKTTTGVGATGADHIFLVGNNGATTAVKMLNSGESLFGTTTDNGGRVQSNGMVRVFASSSPTGGASMELDYTSNTGYITVINRANSGWLPVVVRASDITLNTGGTARWNVNSSGHFLAGTDNTYDIGASGATRPRTGYFGTGVTTPRVNTTGVTASTWTLNTGVFDGGTNAIVYGNSGDLHLTSNAVGLSTWTYYANGLAANQYLYNGEWHFRTAPSGLTGGTITWTDRLAISASAITANTHLIFGSDNTHDIGATSSTFRPRNIYAGSAIVAGTSITATTNLIAGTTGLVGWNNSSLMSAPSDGVIKLSNNGQTDFTRLQLGGTTSSFPSIARNGTGIDFKLADNSTYAPVQSLYERFGSGSPESVVTAPVGAVYHRTDGGAGTSFYVKESGSGNTGWVSK